MLSRKITHAMATQLDRVNEANLRQRLADAEALIERQRDEIKRLRTTLAAYEDNAPIVETREQKQLYMGRPYITPAEAVRRFRVSMATVNRYVKGYKTTAGKRIAPHWEAAQIDGHHWVIFTDVPLTIKRK